MSAEQSWKVTIHAPRPVIEAALKELGPAADIVQPLFVTVDPARDTVPVMAAYLCLIALIFVVINLIVDMLYVVVDPRLRVSSAGGH